MSPTLGFDSRNVSLYRFPIISTLPGPHDLKITNVKAQNIYNVNLGGDESGGNALPIFYVPKNRFL